MINKRILVVDDSTLYQRLLSDVINAREGLEVVGVASDGNDALNMLHETQPDIVTLDILMPQMDGIQTLIELCKRWPSVRTIMLSSLTAEGSDIALDALALGATDYSAKPSSAGGLEAFRVALENDLLPKIEALCGLRTDAVVPVGSPDVLGNASLPAFQLSGSGKVLPDDAQKGIELVAIGVSTGGPEALGKLLFELPHDIGVPIVIVQHMPAEFTTKLARRLDATSALTVVEATPGDKLCAGTAYIAPGDNHMELCLDGGDVVVNLNRDEPENSCRPSVDPLFRSIPAIYGGHCLGVIMTGMGADGLNGCHVLHSAGCPVIVQDEHSSVVWGMPRLVAKAGLAQAEVPLNQMASVIMSIVNSSSRVARGAADNSDTHPQTAMSGSRT